MKIDKQIDEEENLPCKTFLLGKKEGIKEQMRDEIIFLEDIDKQFKFHTNQYCPICQRIIYLKKETK